MKRSGAMALTVLVAVFGILGILFTGVLERGSRPFGLGDYSGADLTALEAAYDQSGADGDLVELLKALCYRAEVEGDTGVGEEIARYGTELFDRARAEETDLSTLDEEPVMLELIGYLHDYGAQ